jgi:hypothetical protein
MPPVAVASGRSSTGAGEAFPGAIKGSGNPVAGTSYSPLVKSVIGLVRVGVWHFLAV